MPIRIMRLHLQEMAPGRADRTHRGPKKDTPLLAVSDCMEREAVVNQPGKCR